MEGKYKKFDKALFEANDELAKTTVRNYISSQGFHIANNKDIYGPDLIQYRGLTPVTYVECEIKHVWTGVFPWETVQLPERKHKYIFNKLRLPVEFWILSQDLKRAITFSSESVTRDRLVEVPNVYNSSKELFFQIPLEETELVVLESAEWLPDEPLERKE